MNKIWFLVAVSLFFAIEERTYGQASELKTSADKWIAMCQEFAQMEDNLQGTDKDIAHSLSADSLDASRLVAHLSDLYFARGLIRDPQGLSDLDGLIRLRAKGARLTLEVYDKKASKLFAYVVGSGPSVKMSRYQEDVKKTISLLKSIESEK